MNKNILIFTAALTITSLSLTGCAFIEAGCTTATITLGEDRGKVKTTYESEHCINGTTAPVDNGTTTSTDVGYLNPPKDTISVDHINQKQ